MKTDLAHELWAILDALNSQSGTNPVGQTIAAFLKVDPDANKVFSFITFVCNQIDLLHEQIKNSTYINDNRKQRVSGYLGNIKDLFSMSRINSNWGAEKTNPLRPEYLGAIADLSDSIRLQFPMKVLTNKDIVDILNEIDKLLSQLSSSDDSFNTSLRTILYFISEFLNEYAFIDKDRAIEKPLSCLAMLQTLEKKPSNKNQKSVLAATFGIVLGILPFIKDGAETIIIIDDFPNAAKNLYSIYLNLIVKSILDNIEHSPIQLPSEEPPAALPAAEVRMIEAPRERADGGGENKDKDAEI